MKKVLQNQKVIMILVVILSLLGINQVISADNDPGKITLTKNATKISNNFDKTNPEYGRLANVTLKVEANPYTEQETTMDKLDIILVLDSSGSMDYTDDGKKTTDDSKKRITSLKSTAKDFVDTMIGNDDKVQIGIVDYADDVKNTQSLTSNKTRLKTFINNLNADGGTNTQSGIVKADELLDNSRKDAKKLVIILTDGIPTYFTYNGTTYGTGTSDKEVCLNYSWGWCTNEKRPSDAAKEALDDLKANHNTTDVYTITFGNADGAAEKLAKINPASREGAKPVYKNVTALNAEDLKKEFQNIQDATRNLIGKNSEVVDTIPKEFKLTAEAKKDLEAKGVKVVENEDGTTTIHWTLGDIEAGEAKAKTLSFDVIAKDEFHGSMYTNQTENYESATLNTTLVAGNPYYKNDKDKNETLKFGSPVVNIPAITNDDHYKDNPSYIGTAQTPINGTTILNNDLDKITKNDKEKAETIITVKDYIIIEENKNTVKISDNQYQLKDNDGKLLGTLIMHEDGTFHFTAEENVTGEVNFDYHIKTTVTKNGKEEYVYSNTSTVTLNILERTKTEVTGTKTWDDADNQDGLRPESITVKLLANGKVIDTKTVNAENDWAYNFNNLYKYEAGHENDENHIIKYTIEEVKVTGYTTEINEYDIENTHTPDLYNEDGKYTVTKVWNDNENQDGIRGSYTVTLTGSVEGEEIYKDSQTLTKDQTTYTWENLQKYNNGKEIVYTVDETEVPEGYTKSVDGNTITNTHTPDLYNKDGKYTVTKVWDDNENQDGIRESYTVTLTGRIEGKEIYISSQRLTKDQTTYTWKDLPKYKDGKVIEYTVDETEVPAGYTKSVKDNIITNTHTPEKTKVSGTKTWDDNNNQDGIRPASIMVNLFANGEKVDSKTVTEEDGWTYTFDSLAKYENGKEVSYTVTEDAVDKYNTEVTGYNIKNTHTPDLYNEDGKYTVTKVWDDKDNQDGIRGNYTVTLTGSVEGEEVYKNSQTLTKDQTSYTWENLQKYNNGKVITYTVDETEIPEEYTKSLNGNTITNTHTPDLYNKDGKYTVTKIWDDKNNQDGIRGDYTVTLTGVVDGEEVYKDSQTLTKDQTSYTWENLAKNNKGKEITYTVDETEIPAGYTKTVNDNVITNTHTPATTVISGTKTWDDNDNQDGIRPANITVNLLANGKVIDSKPVTADNNWTYTFDGLDKYENGKEIAYTVTEDTVDGYSTEINGLNITNTHKPIKIDITGQKVWVDENNIEGLRPNEITVRLFANREEVSSTTVTADNNWKYTFSNLDKFANGQEIDYTVTEDAVEHYDTSLDKDNKFVIVNTHNPKNVEIKGTKTWIDEDNNYGRPDYIIVKLTGTIDDKVVVEASKKVTEKDKWSYSFTNLPEYREGKLINYTVDEEKIRDYDKIVYGYDITNTYNPEKIDISGTKTWNDEGNQDGVRPETITVKLLANGVVVAETTATAETNWNFEFKDQVKYANGKEITYTVEEEAVEGYITEVEGYSITNTHEPEKTKVSGTKTWDDEGNQDGIRPESITVNLLANGEVVNSKTVTEKDGWKYSFNNLPKYENGIEITYTVTEDAVDKYNTEVTGYNIKNTHTPDLYNEDGKYTVTKVWDDKDNQDGIRGNYTVTLTGSVEGEEVYKNSQTLTKDQTSYTWENLQKYNNGKVITYTVDETEVPTGYTKSLNGNTITNTHTPDLYNKDGKYTVTKIWDDNNNQDGIRGSYTVTLTGNVEGEKVYEDSQTLTKDQTTYTWENLPKYNNGKVIEYTVDETEVPERYTKTVNDNVITNTHIPATTVISGTKAWNDNNNQDGIRPVSITVNLLANGKKVDSKVVTEKDNWKYTFANLDKYSNGEEITYTVEEEKVEGYTTKITGYNIENTHTPEVTSVTGTKTWNDNNNQDGIRPASITINLLANGKKVDSKAVTEKDNWTYTFDGLAKYENGKEIAYTVTEDTVDGYSAEINGLNITNTHKPIKIDITGQKVWVDENNIEGLRPNEITVRLFANGKEVSSTTVTADNDWTYTFTNLDKFANGQEIDYTVEEDAVEHYDMSIDKDNKFVIVNTHNPKNVEVTGTKTWIDEDNRYGRPDHITVKLTGKVGDKVVVEETKDVTSEDNWSYSFTDLPEYREGMLITYTIDEEDVKDYDKAINGFDITNTYNPETINITGTKTWNDENNQDGLRPEFITLNLLANGEVVATTTSSAENNWNFEFKDQVVYANGTEITYTVEEVAVDGYTTEIEGFNITNNHTPAVVSYTITKLWNDQNNNDNIRPENITVRLLADGEEKYSQIIDESNNWTYSFDNLPKYKDGGIEIKYEIIEDEVKGYTSSIETSIQELDSNNTNVIITNTHENEKNEITINKIWDDLDNPNRPNSIKVIIYADGVEFRVIELTKDTNWTYILNDLDKYKDGKIINYTILEIPVDGYTTIYNGYDIINSMIWGKGGDVEELPPQTGITTNKFYSPVYSIKSILLILISLVSLVKFLKNTEVVR